MSVPGPYWSQSLIRTYSAVYCGPGWRNSRSEGSDKDLSPSLSPFILSLSYTLLLFILSFYLSLQEPVLSADDVERLTSVSQHVNHLSVLTKVRDPVRPLIHV